MNGMKPVQLGASIALGVLLVGAVAAGLAYGDDLDDLWGARTSATERVQMQGYWMGMRLTPAGTPSELGQPTAPAGVLVAEVSERMGWRARQAGIAPGDIIVKINDKAVETLPDLDAVSQDLNVAGPVKVDLLRWGQPMTLMLPPLQPAAPVQQGIASQPGMGIPGVPNTIPGGVLGPQPTPGMGAAPVANTPAGPTYYCPQHRQAWAQWQVHPHYRCPLCYGPLTGAQ